MTDQDGRSSRDPGSRIGVGRFIVTPAQNRARRLGGDHASGNLLPTDTAASGVPIPVVLGRRQRRTVKVDSVLPWRDLIPRANVGGRKDCAGESGPVLSRIVAANPGWRWIVGAATM